MPFDTSGVRGQFHTTWGRSLEGDLWVGEKKPLTTVATCRCGASITFQGHPDKILTASSPAWVRCDSSGEWFHSLECFGAFDPEGLRAMYKRAQDRARFHAESAATLKAYLPDPPARRV